MLPVVDEAIPDGCPPILFGIEQISAFLFPSERLIRRRRRVQRMIAEVPEADRLPVFKYRGTTCALPSTLLAWIAERERLALSPKARSSSRDAA